jgi:SRSO17 transposase
MAMTARRPCPAAPGPLEAYAAHFDALFRRLAQRHAFRGYLAGLLTPRDRNKTLTALAGAEPVVQAQAPEVQRLQFFLSQAAWDVDAVTEQRLALLLQDALTAPHGEGVLVLDDTGDRKDGTATMHVGRQYLGSVGKIDNGVVAVTSLWADARVYYPLHVEPYTPAHWFEGGKQDPAFRTKPQIARTLVEQARRLGVPFRAVVADSAYGDNNELERAFVRSRVPHVLAHRGTVGRCWAPEDVAHSFEEAIEELAPDAWQPVARQFRDGHTETWWAAELTFAAYGPTRSKRAIVATTDPETLPPLSTWYLSTNLPPAEAPLAEVVRLYGLRVWVEEGYKRVKGELGWADFQVRSDRAIRRHWALVCCAFSFCWWHEARTTGAARVSGTPNASPEQPRAAEEPLARGENRAARRRPRAPTAVLARRAAPRARVAGPLVLARTLLAWVDDHAPAARTRPAPHRRRRRARPQSLPPDLTNHR